MHCTPSLRSLPNVTVEAVAGLVWYLSVLRVLLETCFECSAHNMTIASFKVPLETCLVCSTHDTAVASFKVLLETCLVCSARDDRKGTAGRLATGSGWPPLL